MNVRLDLFLLAWLVTLLGAFQLIPILAAVLFGEPVLPYLGSAIVAAASGVAGVLATRTSDWRIRPRDGFLVVGCGWLLASIFGGVPYLTTGTFGPVDALFESVSGFTTTGSTVMTDIVGAPRALLLWRSFTQWIGGMGIILFTIAILPLLGIGGMQLFKAEVPGPVKDKVRPRLVETARRLWFVYVGFTAAECAALWLAGVDPFEALCHSLTTLATGGFSTRDASIAAFGSPTVEWIITLFMVVAGMNFVLHYRLLTGRVREVSSDAELRYFFFVLAGGAVLIALNLIETGKGVEEAVRQSAFQSASILTTTGYVSTDFEIWPSFAHVLLLVLMILGGMSGSTSGGVKSLRALIGLRALKASFERLVHPRAVRPVKYGGRPVPEEILASVWAFFTVYFLITGVATAVVAGGGYDLLTSVSASLTAIGNVGPGLGAVGAYDNFAHFSTPIKLTLSFCMLAGRLEVFTLLVLLFPEFWRR